MIIIYLSYVVMSRFRVASAAILLLAALGTRNNKEQKITPALELKCPNGIYADRCRIPPSFRNTNEILVVSANS
jgi:hypothetical protein